MFKDWKGKTPPSCRSCGERKQNGVCQERNWRIYTGMKTDLCEITEFRGVPHWKVGFIATEGEGVKKGKEPVSGWSNRIIRTKRHIVL